MTINYDWYTTNYRHAAAYATLIVKATVYNKPFNFIISGTLGQSIKIRDCPEQSGTYGMYANTLQKLKQNQIHAVYQ